MSAVIRAGGTDFDPDRFCAESDLQPCVLWRKGEPVFPNKPEGRRNEESGLNLVASEADFDEFPRQVEETTAFLQAHSEELSRLRRFPGVEGMILDFGTEWRDVFWHQRYLLPPALLRLAGELDMDLVLTIYVAGEDDEDEA